MNLIRAMALKVINKVYDGLRFVYRKNRCVSCLKRLLCNVIIQPYFDCCCSVLYPNWNKKFKSKLQTIQNKCTWFFLQLNGRSHVAVKEFEQLNQLLVSEKLDQYLFSNALKFIVVVVFYIITWHNKQSGQDQAIVIKLKQPSINMFRPKVCPV